MMQKGAQITCCLIETKLLHKTCLTSIISFTEKFVWVSFNVTLAKVLTECIVLLHSFLPIIYVRI